MNAVRICDVHLGPFDPRNDIDKYTYDTEFDQVIPDYQQLLIMFPSLTHFRHWTNTTYFRPASLWSDTEVDLVRNTYPDVCNLGRL